MSDIINIHKSSFVDNNCSLGGEINVGKNCKIVNSQIFNCNIGDNVTIINSYIENCEIKNNVSIGPYAHLRTGCVIGESVHIGNFVEIKKSDIGLESKVNHLTYIGDSSVGQKVNIGAGTITCNYDGANKFRTVIEDDCFIGSDTQLVAPVKVGKGSTIGAGTTVTKDVSEGALVISRVPQKEIKGWTRPRKKE